MKHLRLRYIGLEMSPRRRGVVALRDLLLIHPSTDLATGVLPLRQQVTDALRQDILSGVYHPGKRLIERELVQRFGVSSIPVREALQDLVAQGLVVKRPNIGCFVLDLTREDACQISRLRRLLEPQVVRWAAESYAPVDGGSLCARVDEMRSAAEAGDVVAFFRADMLFHQTIWTIAGNRWASKALETALGSLFAAGIRAALEQGTLELRAETIKHDQIVRFLSDGNADAAATLTAEIALSFEAAVLPALRSGVN
jgi:DNA-binding GntR family transcriptional regulator